MKKLKEEYVKQKDRKAQAITAYVIKKLKAINAPYEQFRPLPDDGSDRTSIWPESFAFELSYAQETTRRSAATALKTHQIPFREANYSGKYVIVILRSALNKIKG